MTHEIVIIRCAKCGKPYLLQDKEEFADDELCYDCEQVMSDNYRCGECPDCHTTTIVLREEFF